MNTYKITAYLKITIEVEAPDDDKAWDDLTFTLPEVKKEGLFPPRS